MADKNQSTVTLLAGGDIGPVWEPTDQFAELVLPVLQQADLRFAQCERSYTERPWAPAEAGAALGPHGNRSGPLHPRFASVWKTAGIDVISMASNHAMDWGGEVLLDTIDLFRGMGKHVIGAGKDIDDARKPAIVERNGVKIAFLGYCSVLAENHEAAKGKTGCAPMRAHTYYQRGGDPHEDFQPGTPQRIITIPYEDELQALVEDVKKAKQQADVVVLSLHWGLHMIPKTICTYQPPIAHAAIDAGADLIIGHHPHCLKAIEVYKGKVCFYSVGNFMCTFGKHRKIATSEFHKWDLYYFRVDPEGMPPNGRYVYPDHARQTLLAKAVFSKKGVEKVSFLPAFINGQAQPAVVEPGNPKFQEILDNMEWLSDQYPHKFRVEGNEVVVDTSA